MTTPNASPSSKSSLLMKQNRRPDGIEWNLVSLGGVFLFLVSAIVLVVATFALTRQQDAAHGGADPLGFIFA